MSEKQKKAIRELTLMLMYLTSWEEAGYARAAGGQEKGPGKVSTCPPVLEGL